MNAIEAAALITKTAIENNLLLFDDKYVSGFDEKERHNAFNAKQIADFFEAIYKSANK